MSIQEDNGPSIPKVFGFTRIMNNTQAFLQLEVQTLVIGPTSEIPN